MDGRSFPAGTNRYHSELRCMEFLHKVERMEAALLCGWMKQHGIKSFLRGLFCLRYSIIYKCPPGARSINKYVLHTSWLLLTTDGYFYLSPSLVGVRKPGITGVCKISNESFMCKDMFFSPVSAHLHSSAITPFSSLDQAHTYFSHIKILFFFFFPPSRASALKR